MCGRYRHRRHWEQDLDGYLRLVVERIGDDRGLRPDLANRAKQEEKEWRRRFANDESRSR
jgi:hypothetical protein